MFLACIAGYIWIYFGLNTNEIKNKSYDVCLFKHTTNIPCPSCGATRSIISLTKGNFVDALRINPLGYLIAFIMILSPLWIVIDFITKRKTLFEFYNKIEIYLKKRQYAIPLIFLLFINWIWNITKGL